VEAVQIQAAESRDDGALWGPGRVTVGPRSREDSCRARRAALDDVQVVQTRGGSSRTAMEFGGNPTLECDRDSGPFGDGSSSGA
jgi:hypothetical protein